MDIIFLGPPGVGKGTQCKRVAEKYGWPHLSTGEIMRSAISAGSELGQQVQSFRKHGKTRPGRGGLADCRGTHPPGRLPSRGVFLTAFPAPFNKPRCWTSCSSRTGEHWPASCN